MIVVEEVAKVLILAVLGDCRLPLVVKFMAVVHEVEHLVPIQVQQVLEPFL